jgi:flagellar hook-associated protein 3 FlgL
MVTRVGDAAQSARIATSLQQTQGRIRDAQTAIASGKAIDRFSDIPGTAGLLLRAKSDRAETTAFIGQNERLLDRMHTVDGTIGAVGDLAERMRALLVNRLDAATGSAVPLDSEIDSALEEVASRLNLRIDGRYVFGGSRTDTAPVVLPSPPATTTDASLYYRGDLVAVTARVASDVELDHGVTAADDGFALLVSALGQARAAHLAQDRAGLESALTDLSAAMDGIAELRGAMGAKAARLEAITESQRSTMLYLDETVSRIEATDIPTALSRLAEDQASLEAAFVTVSRLSQLSLADYLR